MPVANEPGEVASDEPLPAQVVEPHGHALGGQATQGFRHDTLLLLESAAGSGALLGAGPAPVVRGVGRVFPPDTAHRVT